MSQQHDDKKTALFCTTQVLSLLHPPADQATEADVKKFLSGDRFWNERHRGRGGEELEEENPWQPIPRLDLNGEPGLLTRLSAKGDIKRLAIVCTGGIGKSANLEYLAGMLKSVGLVPFHFVLNEKEEKLSGSALTFWTTKLPEIFSQCRGNSELAKDQLKAQHILEKARESGRLTLLFDSVDQATRNGLEVVSGVLRDDAWKGCPVVLTGRQHAIHQHWERLIQRDLAAWHFLRVEPLDEEQRHLLLGPDGVTEAERRRIGEERYSQLPASGQQLMENPRNIEYVRKLAERKPRKGKSKDGEPASIAEFTLADIKTASHLFAGVVDHLVEKGFASGTARRLGYYDPEIGTPAEMTHFQHPLAMTLLSAMAYAMYCWPAPEVADGDEFRPNVSHIPPERIRELLHGKDRKGGVLKLLADADIPDCPVNIEQLEHDVRAVSALNAKLDFCLLDRSTDSGLRWHDRTLQEFLAAWWLARYAGAEDVERLRGWRYDNRMEEAKSLYSPLWGFLVEMPKAVRTAKWLTAVGVLFEHGATRCCEMIYRCCETFEGMRGEEKARADQIVRKWQNEFVDLREKDTGVRGDVARRLWGSRKPCPLEPQGGYVTFRMGSPEGEKGRNNREFQHEVRLTPFGMSRGPVTNEQYELFDPGHESEREFKEKVRDEEELARHPVVNVDWWEGWCFARWVGGRLPTEAEWEYAARGGTTTPFYWGATLNGTEANCRGGIPYGTDRKGDYKMRTTAVGEYERKAPVEHHHPWGLVDVHGNVREWCLDWYDEGFYRRPEAAEANPECKICEQLYRVLRGGSWVTSASRCRAAYRARSEQKYRHLSIGFRLALPCT